MDRAASPSRLMEEAPSSPLGKGSFAMIKGKPCQITEMSTAKSGKHGSSKVEFIKTSSNMFRWLCDC